MSNKVSLAFARFSDAEVDHFTQGVIAGMTDNPAFPAPPVTMANLQLARTEFAAKVALAALGGPPATAGRKNARQFLLGALRHLVSYVQINCNDDLALLLGSGFQAISANHAPAPLAQPTRLAIKNGVSGIFMAWKVCPFSYARRIW